MFNPVKTAKFNFILEELVKVVKSYDYKEITLPILANKSLWLDLISSSDIVTNKQMFDLRYDNNIVLRPEGTAICVAELRAAGKLRHDHTEKVFYHGPMFRHESTQAGRYRQFYQVGLESFGINPLIQMTELLYITWQVFKALNLEKEVNLMINYIGNSITRKSYVAALQQFCYKHCTLTDAEKVTIQQNPLRILDTKNIQLQHQLADGPNLMDFLDETESSKEIFYYLEKLNIPFQHNPRLVRGLDYYNDIVFEWVASSDSALGANKTVCAGGQFDVLTYPQHKLHGLGCAFGIERLALLSQDKTKSSIVQDRTDIYIFPAQARDWLYAFQKSELLRAACKIDKLYDKVYCSTDIRSQKYHLDKAKYLKAKEVIMVSEGVLTVYAPGYKAFESIADYYWLEPLL